MKDNAYLTVESAVNGPGSDTTVLQRVKDVIEPQELWPFLLACLLHWESTRHFDERNRKAVFLSRRIVMQFPALKTTEISPDIISEAEKFTCRAHRAVQQMLFDAMMTYLRQTDLMGIAQWCREQDFAYNDNYTDMIPRRQYQ